ncbi:N-acetylmuramoyl-L-alanine amidase [Oscillospiraceae bacterium PP1C4]
MNFKRLCRKTISITMAAAVCMGLSTVSFAQNSYNDFDYITSHVNLKVPSKLSINRPSENVTTAATAYFITGNSNPEQNLTMNGQKVTTRGVRGSFGVFVSLQSGENTFIFQQGGTKKSVNITRGTSTWAATTKIITSMSPSYDCATTSGKTISLSCIAPSGASVVATVGGRKVTLKQNVATAKANVPAVFSAKTTAGEVKETKNLGPVTYTLNGKSTFKSAGSVFLTGSGSNLIVKVKNNAASVYKDEARSAFIETARLGAVDSVSEISDSMYRLSTGGWIPKDSVQPLTKSPTLKNKVSSLSYELEAGGEMVSLAGSSAPMFRAYQNGEKLSIKLFNTSMDNGWADELAAQVSDSSKLFSDVSITQEDGATTFEFILSGKRALWGYDIRYDENYGTYIYAKYKPTLKSGGQPLKSGGQPLNGVTIAVDAGHGGSDPGALGIPGTAGAMEKQITLASAIAVQKRLESLGANVLMMRTDDSDLSMNDRMTATQNVYADMFISLHGNSIGYSVDANKASGTEVYYFEGIAKSLATSLAGKVSGYTGRINRGAKLSNYRVTLNSYAPSVLVEMGFLSNPAEYDNMTSRKGIFNTANAVGDSVLAALQ